MSVPYPIPAAQVGTYFVGNYYHVIQHQPEVVYQFYNDSSTMLRVDGSNRISATTMLQIHALIMSLNYTGIEIRTAHSLESWSGGVLVMVSGSLQPKNLNSRRKFVETFFLAPEETGYFVLNDVFHFIDEEPLHHYPALLLEQSNLEKKLNTPTAILEPVPSYTSGGEIQPRESMKPPDTKNNGTVENYYFQDKQLQQDVELLNIVEENTVGEPNGLLHSTVNSLQDHTPASSEELSGEPQKHTYASILRNAKVQSATKSVAPQPSANKNVSPASELNYASQPIGQATVTSSSFERSVADMVEDVSAVEDEEEIMSVYVRNLLPTATESEIEEEFKKFGNILPDGVVIRSRKDVGVCYAFVEFEDMSGVHNAVKAGSAYVAGRPVYIEERRPNSNIPSRLARGRGRGRGSYQIDAMRAGLGTRSFGRGNGYDGDNKKTRGNGNYRPSLR